MRGGFSFVQNFKQGYKAEGNNCDIALSLPTNRLQKKNTRPITTIKISNTAHIMKKKSCA